MLPFDDALNRILNDAPRLGCETVALASCVGRILAEDILATTPMPSFDYSAMDGYAFAFADLPVGNDRRLRVEGVSRPGAVPLERVAMETACRIFTGAPIPTPADTVVAQEDVVVDNGAIVFSRTVNRGQHVRRKGEDLGSGAIAISRGERLATKHLGLCAALDCAHIVVAHKPRVTILTTGDELRTVGSAAFPGSVVDGNGPMIASLVNDCGGIPGHVHARDTIDAVREGVRRALEESDLVLTIGGISVGSHDHVREALEAEGVTLDFWKVAIKPGKPLAYGRKGNIRVLGLPGNPAAAFVTAVLFATPLLRAMQRDSAARHRWLVARAKHEMASPDGRIEFARAKLDVDDAGWPCVSLLGHQASGSNVGIARADALAWLPGRGGRLAVGEAIRVLPLIG
jgi:molybdopterin molybdotransferase